jgi:hypothetical protein
LPYKYESKFTANQIKSDEENKKHFEGADTILLHMFKITNKGHSNPDKPLNGATIAVKIYVPVKDLLKSEQNPAKVPSMSFYPDFIQILSRFHPGFFQLFSRFHPGFI